MTEKEGLAQIFVSHIKNARTKLTKRIAGALNWVPEEITIRIGMNCGSALPSLTAPESMGSVSLILGFSIFHRLSVPTSPKGNSTPPRLGFDFGLEPIIAQNPRLVRSLTDRRQFPLRHSASEQ